MAAIHWVDTMFQESSLNKILLNIKELATQNFFYITLLTTRKYMHAETLPLLTKPLYFPNLKYLK
jgi:hypothetical protein